MGMKYHVLGLPHTVTSKEYNACAYTQKVVKFAKMMTDRGHTVIHYGHEDSDLQCTEHVSVTTNKDLKIAYGSHDWRKNFFKFDKGLDFENSKSLRKELRLENLVALE